MAMGTIIDNCTLFNEDCLTGIPTHVQKESVDLILCDLPYGTTQCKWDSVIPLPALWECYAHALKPNGTIVLTASQPFTSVLTTSNLKWFKYSWVWEKSKATGFLNSKRRPLVAHEDILVFAKKTPRYHPQQTQGNPYNKGTAGKETAVYGSQREVPNTNISGMRYPRSVQYFKTAEAEGPVIHPTQKPLALFQYLIKTYTQPGDLVLDSCAGSATTAIACIEENRRFVGFELDQTFFNDASARILSWDVSKKSIRENT